MARDALPVDMPSADPLGTWSVFTLTSPFTESARFGGSVAVAPPPSDGRHRDDEDSGASLDVNGEIGVWR
jgi:hypothetical protein